MQFDRFSVTLLILRPDAPQLDEKAAAALQGAHMAYLADLHEAGYLLAAGPLFDNEFRDLSILNVDPERARELKEQDPAVRAGRFSVKVISWMVPGGNRILSNELPTLNGGSRGRLTVAELTHPQASANAGSTSSGDAQ